MGKKPRPLYVLLPLANFLILIISRGTTALTMHENDDLAPFFTVAVAAVGWLLLEVIQIKVVHI